jgi:hypothetical protein
MSSIVTLLYVPFVSNRRAPSMMRERVICACSWRNEALYVRLRLTSVAIEI